MFVKQLSGSGVHARVAGQRQIVRSVAAGTIEPVTFVGFRYAIGHPHGIAAFAPQSGFAIGSQCLFHLIQGTDKGGRIPAIKTEGHEAPVLKMCFKTFEPFAGTQFGALFDAPAVGNHDRHHGATVLGAPPAGDPVTTALFLGSAVREEGHQGLSRQGHVGILEFGKTQVTTFENATGGVRIDMAAKRGCHAAIRLLPVAVEIGHQGGKPVGPAITFCLFRMQVSGEDIQGIHRGHAMSLPHQPAPRPSGQVVQCEIAGIGRYHIQCTASVAFRIGFEVLGCQGLTGDIDPAGIGHMHHQPQPGTGQPIQIGKPAINGGGVRLVAGGNQMLCQQTDLMSRGFVVLDDAIAIAPAPVIRAVGSGVIRRC